MMTFVCMGSVHLLRGSYIFFTHKIPNALEIWIFFFPYEFSELKSKISKPERKDRIEYVIRASVRTKLYAVNLEFAPYIFILLFFDIENLFWWILHSFLPDMLQRLHLSLLFWWWNHFLFLINFIHRNSYFISTKILFWFDLR